VDRLGDETEAVRRESRSELDGDEHDRGDDGDERCATLRSHKGRLEQK
jgi:hypothetical protein